MDSSDLRKVLAGFCMASLIAGSTFALSACSSGKSACSGDKPAVDSSKSG